MNKKEVVYLSGRMTGLPEYNYPAFFALEDKIKELANSDVDVVNPANVGEQEGWEFKDYLTRCLLDMLQLGVNKVVTLDGWELSKGARLEVHVAKELGIPVVHYDTYLHSLQLRTSSLSLADNIEW